MDRSGSRRAPLIGLSTSELRRPWPCSRSRRESRRACELALGMAYVEAGDRAGGRPVIIPPLPPESAAEIVAPLEALLTPGGPDVHPRADGAPPAPTLGPTEPELDAFELALVGAADRRGLPVPGICRGAQVLNIARGGNLHQHLPDQVGERVVHRQPGPIARPTHTVRMAEGSMLRRVMGRAWAWENSLHHQAVARVAGLRPVAWALDGTVEAIEGDGDGAGFALGVQWHVETLLTRPEHLAVIEALVGAGRAARDERPRRAA